MTTNTYIKYTINLHTQIMYDIYDILEKAEFLENMCFYSDINKLTPPMVANKFLSFDKAKCQKFADKMQRDYNKGMNNILQLL